MEFFCELTDDGRDCNCHRGFICGLFRLALRRPYTIAVCALMIFFLGVMSIRGMLIDIFPVIDIPVVGIVWSYNGLPAEDMERRVNTHL